MFDICETSVCVFERLINRCSNIYKLKRMMAWILRYVSVMRSRWEGKLFLAETSLSVNELQRAETELSKYVQRNHFSHLLSNNSKQKLPRFMQKLDPVSVDDVIRVGGRIDKALADVDVKHPIILPQHSHFTELIIRQKHSKVGRAGTSHTWASIRKRFWIVKGGAAVRHSIGQCIQRKKRNAVVGKQLMADMPSCRLQSDKPPFHNVGVDYFGPFFVKQGRSMIKRVWLFILMSNCQSSAH